MPNKIIDMLKDTAKAGSSTEDIKDTVISTLSPYFINIDQLLKYWTNSELLSTFEFIIRYHNDSVFFKSLDEVLKCYRKAYQINKQSTLNTIYSTLNYFSQRENLMWTVKNNVTYLNKDDFYEKIIAYMKHIGDTLEIGTKHIACELYAILKICNNVNIDYEKMQKFDFGILIQNILDQGKFNEILKTNPLPLKLSDWRNIAYHHSYSIENEKIICTYGKDRICFTIVFDDLEQYVYQIVRASNILNIARCIFVFDILSDLKVFNYNEKSKPIEFRKSLLIDQLKISLLSQEFLLESYLEQDTLVSVKLYDLLNNGTLDEQVLRAREIHSTQFLYNIWSVFRKDLICIEYCSKEGDLYFVSSVSGNVCQMIEEGKEELAYLSNKFDFKFVKR